MTKKLEGRIVVCENCGHGTVYRIKGGNLVKTENGYKHQEVAVCNIIKRQERRKGGKP